MELGTVFVIPIEILAKPLEGRLVEVTVDGEEVKCRVLDVGTEAARVKVVPNSLKE